MMSYSPVVTLAQKLIKQSSNHHCHKIITDYLHNLNFNIELMQFEDTLNIWAYHGNEKKQKHTLLFLGHTDVVDPGNTQHWKYPPFSGVIQDNILYGRGAVDMKGALAAMLAATKNFIDQHSINYQGRIAFIITSDEEGAGTNGTTKVVESLIQRNESIHYCIVGEPSSQHHIGDVIKNGRRGSLMGTLTIYGSQGHVAYPQFSQNPIHLSIPALSDILNTTWDQKKDILFPPTIIQIINVNTNNTNYNLIPHKITFNFNFRFNNMCTIDNIKNTINKILIYHNLIYNINWNISAEPYFSKPGKLTHTIINVVKHYQKFIPKLETTGGTSDGRFIAKTGAEIIELGALNHTIHKCNEHINIADLQLLSSMYHKIMENLLLNT